MKPTPTPEMIEAFYKAHDEALELQPRENHQAVFAGLSAALSVQPAAAVVGEPVGYVSTPELMQLKTGASCVDLFREPQPGGIDFAPVYGRPHSGKPWRVFEAITHGWWGIEVDGDNDADPILYPIKINRESLEKIVKHFNESLGGKP